MQPNKLLSIDEVWLAVSVDAAGNEGVCAALVQGAWMPLIAADEERLAFVREQAKIIAKSAQCLVRIVKLSTRTDVDTFDGR